MEARRLAGSRLRAGRAQRKDPGCCFSCLGGSTALTCGSALPALPGIDGCRETADVNLPVSSALQPGCCGAYRQKQPGCEQMEPGNGHGRPPGKALSCLPVRRP